MKLLHVMNAVEFSGAETMIATSAGDLSERGFEVVCLATGDTEGSYASVMRSHGVRVDHVRFKPGSPAFVWRVWRYVRANGFEVVHIHCERATFRYALAARLAGAGVVVRTIHSVFSPTGVRAVIRGLLRHSSSRLLGVAFVFASDSIAFNERRRFRTPGMVVRNFVDERRFFPARDSDESDRARTALGVPHGAFVVALVGACAPVKRHGLVIRAIAEADAPVYCLHAGAGSLECSERELADALGVSDRVRFLGSVNQMRDIYIASDCHVMPSKYEGLGLAAIEAASCAIPTVAFDVPGLCDVVEDGATGVLVREASSRELARTLTDYSGARERLVALGQAARTHVATAYSRTEWVSRHLRLYSAFGRDVT